MSHTKEPWGVPADGNLLLADSDGNILVTGGGNTDYGMIAYVTLADDARRIVACVNACAGIDTERLEDLDRPLMHHLFGADQHASNLVRQRDELLTALKASRKTLELANVTPNGPINDTIWHGDAETLFDFMDAAIEKAESAQ